MSEQTILEVRGLTKHFHVRSGALGKRAVVHAMDDIDFSVKQSETLGIVGESGSGKSTLGRVAIRLLDRTEGQVIYKGQEITTLNARDFRSIRRELQMIFQDPYASLNPRMKVGDAIREVIMANHLLPNKKAARKRVEELFELVGLQVTMYDRYPHEFSGGQRQRVSIARALALEPEVLVCDEAVSALDVSVQAQILNLFNRLKKKFDLTYLFISHDLAVVKYVSDRIMVMYLGEVVEMADTEELFQHTLHPYTTALISVIPEPSTKKVENKIILEGDIPSPIHPPSGCRFRTRCFRKMDVCETVHPELREVSPGHFVRCHLVGMSEEVAE
ncbi:MAG: ABC transporter ATP-binding protein [Anaerolineaceae bacterium]|nr:ABC transporter ATP-binding protein [Anaerolineaceae bacterium]